MKKLILLALFSFFAARSFATVTFTLAANPCDTNKILVAHFSGTGVAPYTIRWWSPMYPYWGDVVTHTITTGTTDTLYHYNGTFIFALGVTDAMGNTVDTGSFAGVPPPFTFTFANTSTCSTIAPASVTITGGTPPYTYYWYAYNDQTTTLATTNPAMLSTGVYGVTIIDAAGCINGSQMTILNYYGDWTNYLDTIHPTPTFSLAVTSTDANCTNGTASLTSISPGAISPVSYLWSNGATAPSIAGLVAGSYSLTVTDSVGCVAYTNAHVNQTTIINAPTTPTAATCIANDGAITTFGSGGTPPYSYLWSNGATTASQTGLSAGLYNVVITDANGCTGSGGNFISSSTPITVTYTTTPSLCTSPTGTATITIAGGTPPYTDTFYTSPLQTGTNATNLAPGTYPFHVVDAMGCVQNGSVIVPPIDVLNLAFALTPALCTLSNGSMNIGITGGVAPYTYSWSTGATTSGITSQPSGTYAVTVADANGCAKTKYDYLPYTSPVSVGVSSTPASCIFVNDGSASASGIGGTAPYSYHWSNGSTISTISSLAAGQYWVDVADASGCIASNYDYVGYNAADSSCFCTIKGTVYYDMNGNCIQDAGEPGVNNIQIYCSGIGYTYTDASGAYSFIVPAGSYTITQTVLAYYPLAACQLNNIPVTTSAGAGCVHTVDFANSINPIHDISVRAWDYSNAIPGNTYSQACLITNNGTIAESNILGGYNTDGQLFSPTFLPSGVFTAGATYWYNTTGGSGLALAPGATQLFYINYAVPTFIPIGTPLVFKDSAAYTAPISNWLTDYSPWDNVNYFTSYVVASYDPNFIEVTPQGVGATGNITYADSTLEYMVHFQNTGTSQAQNIVVIDTLDPNLDWTTLRPVYESAPCKVTLSTNGIVKFTFSNINLPTAASGITSNGMFTYTIKTKPGLSIGTQFKNHASIYFDYNTPVVTNTAVNTLWWPEGVHTVINSGQFNSFAIYPNPTNQSFNAVINSDDAGNADMNVSDITGKTLISKTIALQKGAQTITIDASQLAPGVYFVSFKNHGKVQTQKLVIMK